jgi:hypothetical protein
MNIDFNDVDVLISIHHTLGILTDFAIQVDDKLMIDRLYQSEINEFKDSVMDFAIWGIKDNITITFDRNIFIGILNDLYSSLKKGMILVV